MTGERNRIIQFDINSTPLQIYTDSEIGSGDVMWVQFMGSGNTVGISVILDSTPNYRIGYCINKPTEIQKNRLGENKNRIWTIEQHGTRWQLFCNGVKIFDYDTQTSNDEDCRDRWSSDFTTMRFRQKTNYTGRMGDKDTASDLYREHTIGIYSLYLL